MVFNHLAAVLLFSGPFLWLGLWAALDPALFIGLAGILVSVFRPSLRAVPEAAAEVDGKAEYTAIFRQHRRAVRVAGMILAFFAVVF